MASVASQLIQEVTAHAQSDSLEDAREICADVLTSQITYVQQSPSHTEESQVFIAGP